MYILSEQFAGYTNQLLVGAWITLELFVSGFTLAFVLGTVIGIATQSRHPVVQAVWRFYASIMTGVPSLLVIFLLYYGGGAMITALFGKTRFEVTAFGAGVAALAIVYAAYIAELIQGAVRNLPKGQFEAARSLAIKPLAMWWHVILPQVFRLAFPGLVNIWMIVLKDTPLVSLAGLNDLVAMSKIAAGATKEPFVFFIVAALFFIAFSALTLRLANWAEERLNRGLATVKA
jgi:polar amino acid transport system permease protein